MAVRVALIGVLMVVSLAEGGRVGSHCGSTGSVNSGGSRVVALLVAVAEVA